MVVLVEVENWEVRSVSWECRRGSWDVIDLDQVKEAWLGGGVEGDVLVCCVLDLRFERLDA